MGLLGRRRRWRVEFSSAAMSSPAGVRLRLPERPVGQARSRGSALCRTRLVNVEGPVSPQASPSKDSARVEHRSGSGPRDHALTHSVVALTQDFLLRKHTSNKPLDAVPRPTGSAMRAARNRSAGTLRADTSRLSYCRQRLAACSAPFPAVVSKINRHLETAVRSCAGQCGAAFLERPLHDQRGGSARICARRRSKVCEASLTG